MANRKTVLITGCGQCSLGGIGFELAKEYHSKGLRVIATARSLAALDDLTALGLETFELDVTKPESVQAGRDRVVEITGGTLDILVNNAGQGKFYMNGFTAQADCYFDRRVNLFGVMRMVQEFAPLLLAAEGRIVNIGSISGIMPYPFGSSYNASKAALHSYGNTLRLEMAPFNVQVTTIITGGVKSNISRHRRLIQPTSIYAPIADIYAERRAARSQVGATATDVYAKRVVAQTLKRRARAWFWTGNFSFFCWFIDTFAGRRGFDWLFSSAFGLSKLKNIISSQKKQE